MNKQRLLELADLLDNVDEEHIRKGEPTYYQYTLVHPCGTPACAIGHWAMANPSRWKLDKHKTRVLLRRGHDCTSFWGDARKEFDLNETQVCELFEAHGCGRAQTGKEAARYIRDFVARNEATE